MNNKVTALLEASIALCSHLHPTPHKCFWCAQEDHLDAPYCPVLKCEEAIEALKKDGHKMDTVIARKNKSLENTSPSS